MLPMRLTVGSPRSARRSTHATPPARLRSLATSASGATSRPSPGTSRHWRDATRSRRCSPPSSNSVGPTAWRVEGEPTVAGEVLEAWVKFETKLARGRSILRLKDGRAWTLLTAIEELKGFEERKGPSRPVGVEHGVYRREKTRLEAKRAEDGALGKGRQPYCVVIGGGQGGIMLGARLKQLNVPTIILEKNSHPGDSWRNRYRSLVLHDPVWYDHLPYIPFPENWPIFTPKDKLGDWLEMYTRVMELNYWSSSEAVHAAYDADKREWTVEVSRDGARATLKPKQLVFATGAYGPPNVISLPGLENFQGQHFHSSRYKTGAPYENKDCIVIGANSSAHDIAADLWEYGARVTMLQRSPTTVVRSETLMELGFEPLYSENALKSGITTDNADLAFAATPFCLMPRGQIAVYKEVRRRDAAFYDSPRKVRLSARLRRGRIRPHDEGIPHRLGLLHRCRRLGSHREGPHRRQKRRRDPPRQRALCRAHGRLGVARRSHRDGDRIPINEPRGGAHHFRGSCGQGRQVLGARLRRSWRPGAVGGRATKHVEANRAAGPLVSRWQPSPVAPLFARARTPDQGTHGGAAYADLWTAEVASQVLIIQLLTREE